MKLIESKAEYIPQTGLYKHIELCGRIAYKSEDKITEDSAKGFVDRMIKSKHGAVLEHGTVYLIAKVDFTNRDIIDLEARYIINPYSKVIVTDGVLHITTNYRVIIENNWLDDMKYISKPTEFHEKRYTIKFTTDRGVSHELVRHRKFSFLQESTRYCNYTKGKFGNELTFIIPSWYNKFSGTFDEDGYRENGTTDIYSDEDFVNFLKDVEANYKAAITAGATPQEARQVLPNAIKTEIVMTGFVEDWIHFFNLRWKGTTGKPHPDMVILAKKALEEFEKANIKEIINII